VVRLTPPVHKTISICSNSFEMLKCLLIIAVMRNQKCAYCFIVFVLTASESLSHKIILSGRNKSCKQFTAEQAQWIIHDTLLSGRDEYSLCNMEKAWQPLASICVHIPAQPFARCCCRRYY